MKESKRIHEILEGLAAAYSDASCALRHQNAFQLLVATILSAQCTDERVNQVTPELFERFPTPAKMAEASLEELQEIIRSTGFFRNKAKNLKGASQRLVEEFDGEVPKELEALTSLPGVARKTANVVLGTWYGLASGVVVDTHVKRVSNRLGMTSHSDPKKIEKDLMSILPKTEWIDFSHRVIRHGRTTCKARSPRCGSCSLADLCPYFRDG